VSILEGVGSFEVREGGASVCTGRIRPLIPNEEKLLDQDWAVIEKEAAQSLANPKTVLTGEDVYKRLRFLGYEYTGAFRGIRAADSTGTFFKVDWNSNWISYLDTLLQTTVRIYSAKGYPTDLSVPTEIPKLVLNPAKFQENFLPTLQATGGVLANYNPQTSIIKSKGVEIEGLKMTKLSSNRKEESPPIISRHAFDPYLYEEGDVWKNEHFTPILQCMSIVMENFTSTHDKITMTIPIILEICTKAPSAETLKISSAVRVHFAMPDVSISNKC